MYQWRKLSEAGRQETLRDRQSRDLPWHDLPCRDCGRTTYLISAACYEHQPVIGVHRRRMGEFCEELVSTVETSVAVQQLHAWVVLPNHYHLLCEVDEIRAFKSGLGKLHGRTSFRWNREDSASGRKVWFRAAETVIKSLRHFSASLNYVHGNPAKHRCVEDPGDWPWSSFRQWKATYSADEIATHWRDFPTDRYGRGWDDQSLAQCATKLLE